MKGRLQYIIRFECAECIGVQERRVRHGRHNRPDFEGVLWSVWINSFTWEI